MKSYVYIHTRLDTNEVFYVGIGSQDNYKRASSTSQRTYYWNNIVKKCGWKVDIVFDKLSWEDACIKEKELILKYGRIDLGTGLLVNLTNGGEGNFGRKASIETRLKMSKTRTGKKLKIETKKKLSIIAKGKFCKKVINTEDGTIYNSISDAAKQNGLKRHNLSEYLTGRVKNKTALTYFIEDIN